MPGKREQIVELARELMARRGADAMGMRELADAAGLNVATLYHYFPSKTDLLAAVLEERGYLDLLAGPLPVAPGPPEQALADLLEHAWSAMLAVEDHIRIVLGEALRAEDTARQAGVRLRSQTEASLERWAAQAAPDLARRVGAGPLARLLQTILLGVFVEHLAGHVDDPVHDLRRRAEEIAHVLTTR